MNRAKPFDSPDLEALAKVLEGAATHAELRGLFQAAGLAEVEPVNGLSKWRRIFNALAAAQNKTGTGNFAFHFIQLTIAPKRFVNQPVQFEQLRDRVNRLLAFHGWHLTEDGRFKLINPAATINEAWERAGRLSAELERRNVHPDVLAFCRPELLQENYFHAVFEATKSVAEKIRQKASVQGDGAEIVDAAFGLAKGAPILAINSLQTKTEEDEQKGFSNLLKGTFGMFRNVTGHAPKIRWAISEQDALDLLTLVSLIHRRLDETSSFGRKSP
jgi:uncharacterized protein (TIGR02391 family)